MDLSLPIPLPVASIRGCQSVSNHHFRTKIKTFESLISGMYLDRTGTDFSLILWTGTVFLDRNGFCARPDRFGPERIKLRTGPDRTGPVQTGLVRAGPDQPGPVWTGPVRTGLVHGPERTGPVWTGFAADRNGPDFLDRIFFWTGTDRTGPVHAWYRLYNSSASS